MMKKTVFWTTLIVLIASIAAAQQQTPAGDHHPQGQAAGQQQDTGQGWLPPWAQSLSAEKKAAVQRIYETRTGVIYPLMLQLRAQQAQLQAELAQDNVNQKTINQILDQINNLEAKINRAQVDLMLDIKKELPQAFMRHAMMGSGMGLGTGGMGIMGGGCPMGMMGGGMMGGGGQGMMGGMMGGAGMMGNGGSNNRP
jgi:hypothetical protein